MHRSFAVLASLLLAALAGPESLIAQMPDFPGIQGDFNEYVNGRYGAFLSVYKLVIIGVIWLAWVFVADRTNQDLLRWAEDLEVSPAGWNSSILGSFLLGLLAVLLIPIFWIGAAVLGLAAFLPPFIYSRVRSSRMKASATVAYRVAGKTELKQEDFALAGDNVIQFVPPGDLRTRQKLQIDARQSPAYELLRNLLGNGLTGRVDTILLDYSKQGVSGRMQIDGVWIPMPPLDRVQGDAMLEALKALAGLNPKERRQRQRGAFEMKWEDVKQKSRIELTSQGVATGEQAQIKYLRAAGKPRTYPELRMNSPGAERARQLMNAPGLIILSAPAQGGLTTIWQSSLVTMDRMMRDVIVFMQPDEHDSEVENVQKQRFSDKEEPAELLRRVLLTQPNVLVFPDLVSPQLADLVISEVADEQRTVITRAQANSAAAAVLKVLPQVGDRKQFVEALTCIVNQRLVRRLCHKCRVSSPAKSDLITKLGGNPSTQKTLFNPYQLPPLEQRVDEKGNPVHMEPCTACNGTGFRERIAALEVIEVDDSIRKVLREKPEEAAIEKAFRASGARSLMEEATRLVLAGETSLDEVRRVFRPAGSK